MNDIKVYTAETTYGEACLIPAQLFQRLYYHDFGDGVGVEIKFQSEPNNPWRGTLSATFQHEVVLNEVEAFAIRFGTVAPAKDSKQPTTGPSGVQD